MPVTQSYTLSTKSFEAIVIALEHSRFLAEKNAAMNAKCLAEYKHYDFETARLYWVERVANIDAAIKELTEQVA